MDDLHDLSSFLRVLDQKQLGQLLLRPLLEANAEKNRVDKAFHGGLANEQRRQ